MKKILLLGDSICIGYRSFVKKKLDAEQVEVVYPSENGKMANHLYRMLFEWNEDLDLNSENVIFVYWNAGLWDCVRIFGDDCQTPIDQYSYYIEKIHYRLKKLFPKAILCFATTTPVNENSYNASFFRRNSEIFEYNEKAKRILEGKEEIDDVWDYVNKTIDVNEDYSDATHFSGSFNELLSEHISQKIRTLIKGMYFEVSNNKYIIEHCQEIAHSIAQEKNGVYIWGAGKRGRQFAPIIDEYGIEIKGFIDSNEEKIGKKIILNKLCYSPEILEQADTVPVIIIIDDKRAKANIASYCDKHKIKYCLYDDLLKIIVPVVEQKRINSYVFKNCSLHEEQHMTKYIGINVPAYGCNFNCMYCYLDNKRRGKDAFPALIHSPQYIRYQLRREKLGGAALVGICAYGETMLTDKIVEVCYELLKEGHYLHIVTNGICADKIKELIEISGEYSERILFKISFHYLELKSRKLLERFSNNIHMINESRASYTIELMPHDEIIPMIDEIKEYSINNFGALPQLTIGRDENNEMRLLTSHSKDEYIRIWSTFDSEMFETRMNMYMIHGRNCNAGVDGFFVDLYTGDVNRCVYREAIDDFYSLDFNPTYDRVGDNCPLGYCFNCHVYATLGMMIGLDVPSYYEIRDRVMNNGKHWIKEPMRKFIDVKLYDNAK